jgi:hypothetical protein
MRKTTLGHSKPNHIKLFIRLMLIPVIAACGLFAAGCEAAKGKPFAEKAVGEFHTQLNAQQFAQIYAATAPEFKKSTEEAAAVEYFTLVHTKMGEFKSANQTGFNANSDNGVSSVTLDYDTEYANGKATETFVYKVEGEKVSLVNFKLTSDAMKK